MYSSHVLEKARILAPGFFLEEGEDAVDGAVAGAAGEVGSGFGLGG